MYTIIEEIQNGSSVNFEELLKKFKPLIFKWLMQSKQIATEQREDLFSEAKLLLYECALKYDKSKGVPFESFYKITLYHWYSNKYRKKQIETVALEERQESSENNMESSIIMAMVIDEVRRLARQMNENDQKIINLTIEGYGSKEVAFILGMKYKTLRNRKALILKKIRDQFISDSMSG